MRRADRCPSPSGAGRGLCALLTVVLALLAGAPAADDVQRDIYEEALVKKGIEPDTEGIRAYLRQVHSFNVGNELVAGLIRQLGSDEFAKREEATRKLLALPVVPEAALVKATQSADLEVRCRAEEILEKSKDRSNRETVIAALRTIQRKHLKGAADVILKIVPLFPSGQLRAAAIDAIAATVRPEDLALLREAVKGPDPNARAAGVAGLAALLGKDAGKELRGLLADKSDRVRLAVCRALADVGDRASLAPLGGLLAAEDVEVRADAAFLLRALAGKNFGFVPYSGLAERSKAARAWREWIETEGKTAKLHFPLAAAIKTLGRTVLCLYGGPQGVIEVDAAGKETFRIERGQAPWACQALPSGHLLVGFYASREIVEFDRKGKVVWQKAELPGGPMSVQRLQNGNTVAALSDSNKVVEIDRKGTIVWQVTVAGRPADARRLPNGRTLVAAHNGGKVLEVDKDGKVVWALAGLHDPQRAQRLPNGNTLVALTLGNTVAEYDRSGKQVWSKAGFTVALDAHRLPNGNTLVVDQRGVWEINRAGETVWKLEKKGVSRAWRH
ncbi:MAG TPA: PQQ-binding-like beta-propeller repeat protein [Phycisphaerae bacterium]|nr:PQQ-binding-like beta-propeller repeat protein [Phycisphaerae bacterium]